MERVSDAIVRGMGGTVSAVIPTWNRADLLDSILTDLTSQTRPPEEIIVVDNGSTDETEQVARRFAVSLITFTENRGFAVAVNAGIVRASGDWILIVNNDVLLEPSWLERLLATAEQENASFAVGKLLRPDDRTLIDGTWDLVSRAAYAWRCGFERLDGAVWSTKRQIAFAPMTAALFHRRVFDQIGQLEARFESYYEDVEFGVRCALAGLKGVYEPAAVALHISKTTLGKNRGRVMFLTARNQILLLAKHYAGRTLWRFAWPICVGNILALMAAARQGCFGAALHGKWEGLRQWSSFREEPREQDSNVIEAVFLESEREIRRLQRLVGFNPYWRLYFSLVRPI